MIKAVIFDIDNTMYDFDGAHRKGMAALGGYMKANFGMTPEETEALTKKCMDIIAERTGDSAAQHNRLLRFQCMLEQLGCTDYQKAMEMYHVYWDAVIEGIEPEPGLIGLLSRLKARGVRLGVGSDMTAYIQYKKLKKLGVLPYLDFLVMSEEAGAEKPAPRFFELCLKKAGCLPEECVFIGDNPKKDVIGAAKCGLMGTWYHPEKDDTGAERSECASQSAPCRETWYHPEKDDTGVWRSECASQSDTGYPVVTSYEDYLRE